MNIGSIIERIDSYRVSNRSAADHSNKSSVKLEASSVREPDKNEVAGIVDKLNSSMENINERVSFSYYEENNRIIIRVVDTETKEVVREIPPKDLIKLNQHIQEYLGMLVDESR